jgi:DNA gyrase subunit A
MEMLRTITRKDIGEVVETSMVDYAEKTILDRAIPDVRDGLKPVQRRILYGMGELNLWFSGKTLKCARIVGEVLGKYHPHGDSSVYGALTRMAQDFAMRVPLVKGQGNFGSIDGDSPAAMRYTEAKLSQVGELLLADIDMDTVDFGDNFDGMLKEPTVLPTRIPNLLINGSTGIAVGMSTDILPHNLNEVCQAVSYIAARWGKRHQVTVDELMKIIPGPDLPTGGLLYRYRRDDKDGTVTDMIRTAYDSGYSPLVCTAKADFEKNGKNQIIITEIPYQISKTTILERVAKVRERLIGKISDVVDESDQDGLRIVFEVARGCEPQVALEALLSYTNLRTTLSCNHLVLNIDDDGTMYPEIMPLRDLLIAFIKHRLVVIVRRARFEKRRAEARLHIVIGLLAALAKIEEVIAIIKKSRDVDTARANLIKLLKIDDIQAQAILDMQLRRLAGLEVRKLQDEKKELDARIQQLAELLASESKRLARIVDEMKEINERFPTPRRTIIVENTGGDRQTVTVADLLVPEKPQLVMITSSGVQRTDADTYRDAVPVGKASTRAVDTVLGRVVVEPKESVLLVSSRGRLWLGNVGRLPNKGGFDELGLDKNEYLVGIGKLDPDQYLTIGTRWGNLKRMKIADVLTSRSEGAWTAAVGLEGSQDEVLFAQPASDQAQVLVFTQGNAATGLDPRVLRFEAGGVNPQATPSARGVTAIKLREGDVLISGLVFEPDELADGFLITITQKGFAKKVKLAEYPLQGRAGQGVQALKPNAQTGLPAACTLAKKGEMLDLVSENGKRLRLAVNTIPDSPRAGKGEDIAKKFDGLFGGELVMDMVRVSFAPGARISQPEPQKVKPAKTTRKAEPSPKKAPSSRQPSAAVSETQIKKTSTQKTAKKEAVVKPKKSSKEPVVQKASIRKTSTSTRNQEPEQLPLIPEVKPVPKTTKKSATKPKVPAASKDQRSEPNGTGEASSSQSKARKPRSNPLKHPPQLNQK